MKNFSCLLSDRLSEIVVEFIFTFKIEKMLKVIFSLFLIKLKYFEKSFLKRKILKSYRESFDEKLKASAKYIFFF